MKKSTIVLCLALLALWTTAFAAKTAYLGQTRPYVVEEFNVPEEADIIEVDESGRAIYSGTTCDMGNDYQFNCEVSYTDLAPDVAYTFIVYSAGQYTFDLCGSSFDTRLGIFDASGNLLCCNDDACGHVPSPGFEDGPFASKIECCELTEGTYTVVVDGWTSAAGAPSCGEFVLSITQCFGCEIECPTSAVPEPEICHQEVNSGCNSTPPSVSAIDCNSGICGTAYAENGTRDVDFYQVHLDAPSILVWCVTAEYPVVAAILDPTDDCFNTNIYVIQDANPCTQVCVTSPCLPAGDYWLFTAPNSFDNIACSDYFATLSCIPCGDCQGTEAVYFQPGTGLPPSQCVDLCLNQLLPIYVCAPSTYPPIVTVREGCFYQEPGCDVECPPATFFYDPAAWTIDPATGCWVNVVRPLSDGCACISFDGFLPVELLSFGAVAGDAHVTLSWETASETNNDRFEILRDGDLIGQRNAQGNSTGHRYTFVDDRLMNGTTYGYTLVSVDVNGARETLGTVSATPIESAPSVSEYALEQNYPNPFNPTTSIHFALAEASTVTLTIFNLAGQEVATLVNGSLAAGAHNVTFDARDLPSGMYLYRLEAGSFTASRKMMLMK
ncbi:MAG: T9SS type A sorting domain-containing protein [bacterium]|nr:T9SS type A sorting domain-containing protein [bacterium]